VKETIASKRPRAGSTTIPASKEEVLLCSDEES